jgi:hypothetical protein
MTLQEAAEKYSLIREKSQTVSLKRVKYRAFIEGARFERERILEMLRSEEAWDAQRYGEIVGPKDWAAWIEEQLENEK